MKPSTQLKAIFVGAFALLLLVVIISWCANLVSPAEVRTFSQDDLQSVKICRQCKCAELDRALWPELIQHVGRMEFTFNTGRRKEASQELYELRFDWGKNGDFSVRLWTRPSIGGNIIATFQKEQYGGTSYYGDYAAKELYDWLDKQVQSSKLIFTDC